MDSPANATPHINNRTRMLSAMLVAIGLVMLLSWLAMTPAGALGKADAIGYAVCHRIDGRSFHLGERALPMCARCTGMYLGVLVAIGTFLALGRRRSGVFPAWPYGVVFGLFAAAWAADGVNSYLSLFPMWPHLYEPNNVLRIVTGTLLGLGMGTLVFTGFNQTVWRSWKPESAIQRPHDLLWMLGLSGLMIAAVLTENPLVLYPLALLSSLSVLGLLTVIYAMILLLVFGRDNRAEAWNDLRGPLVAGFVLALGQIVLFDAARLWWTGTWQGFLF
jgi:uncharacterized membrane protein